MEIPPYPPPDDDPIDFEILQRLLSDARTEIALLKARYAVALNERDECEAALGVAEVVRDDARRASAADLERRRVAEADLAEALKGWAREWAHTQKNPSIDAPHQLVPILIAEEARRTDLRRKGEP